MNDHRDAQPDDSSASTQARVGRNFIVTIGIDEYRHWRSLTNAVSDARGAQRLFQRLGFEEAAPPLLNAKATEAALRALVADDLATLGSDDSLVIFYAGHGGSRTYERMGQQIRTGYLIPSDADRTKVSTWIDLESWLHRIALLPPRHILVILDACYSGIALDPVIKWRDAESDDVAPFETLQARCSRRVITSALDNELALDGGPVAGHSLFTGCLIEALTGGIAGVGGMTTGAEVAVWVRQRVRTYPRASQTPDFGTFDFHDRGEIVIPLLRGDGGSALPAARLPAPARPEEASGDPDREPTPALVAPAIGSTRGDTLRAKLRREGDWLMIVVPLLVIAVIGALSNAC